MNRPQVAALPIEAQAAARAQTALAIAWTKSDSGARASLLLHEGRSVIYVARQLGHGADLTLKTYGHVIDELDHAPQLGAEEAIRQAREGVGALACTRLVPAEAG